MDLVAGATGQVGRRVVLRLREKGRSVRAIVRGGAERAEAKELLSAGIEAVVCTATSMPHGREDGLRRVDREGVLALIEAVILRPSYFMEAWLSPVLGFDAAKATARIYGSGEATVSYISALDVVEFAVAAATQASGGREVLELGGPEAVSQLDAVRIFERALGKKFRRSKSSIVPPIPCRKRLRR